MISPRLPFQIQAQATGSRARAATFRTLHNEVLTPLFMPVGTQATVKAQLPETLLESGSQILLANTYHLLLRPGPEVFQRLGGIHGLMQWERSVLTDSGGFQIFSLPHSRSMREEGAIFKSYVDGTSILLSPELSIQTQRAIGSDIMMVLDQCIPSTAPPAEARQALALTQRWAARSLAARGDAPAALFAIVQGALFPELRAESAAGLTTLPFEGYAIGGLAVGESRAQREDVCAYTTGLLPEDRPRYLMGVGTPLDLLEGVHRGVDMFDCIIPTQVAQRGSAFTSRGLVQFRRSVYKFAEEPLDPACGCPVCRKYSRAYLHHLHKCEETLGWTLLGQHNLYYYHQLMREIRQSILEDRFLAYYEKQRLLLDREDVDHPSQRPAPAKSTAGRLQLGEYEVHTAREGFASIRQRHTGEIMHSHTPPMVEAETLYVAQSALAQRLPAETSPLVLWDVGLGAAANAMAAILCYEKAAAAGPVRPLHIVSFENDLDSLRLALRHKDKFPYLRHGGPDTLLKQGTWTSRTHPGLSWSLLLGNFAEQMPHAPALPDLIYYDLFSSQSSPAHWTADHFAKLFAACAQANTELYTYSTSTAARVAMLGAGFHVAHGQAIGVKSDTTIACTPLAVRQPRGLAHRWLGEAWLGKWSRSHAQFPPGLTDAAAADFAQRLRAHPQFQ